MKVRVPLPIKVDNNYDGASDCPSPVNGTHLLGRQPWSDYPCVDPRAGVDETTDTRRYARLKPGQTWDRERRRGGESHQLQNGRQ